MLMMEGQIDSQAERIVALEEELAVLRTKKACKCGEAAMSAVGSGSQEDPLDVDRLEYTKEGESSNRSYHTPPRVQESPLRIFGSPVISQASPESQEAMCSYPVPSLIRIEDDMEMVAAPRENIEPIPVRVEEPPRYNVGVQCASRGRRNPVAHYSSHRRNDHHKQLGYRSTPTGYFLDEALGFPSRRGLAVIRGGDKAGIGYPAGSSGDSSNLRGDADGGRAVKSPSFDTDSTGYRPCSPDCGGDCLSGSADLR